MMKPTHLGALLLIYAYAACGDEVEVQERQDEVIRLGLHFVYDKAFSDGALFEVNRSFNAYFTALTRAAQEFFNVPEDLKIFLTLVGSSRLEEEDIIRNTTINGTNKLNASETLDKLGKIITWNETFNDSVDIVFLATGKQLHIKESWMTGEWYGLAYPRSICFGNATVGIIHDDGANFNGVRLTALQVALLLGAKKDNGRWGECPQNEEEQYLTSSSTGGRIPYLSKCSRASVRDFYYRVKDRPDICWKDTPKAALQNHIGFPVEFYKLFDCDHCHVAEHFRNKTERGRPINCSLSTINRNIDHWPSTTTSRWHRSARRRNGWWYRRHPTTVSPYKNCKQECCRFIRYNEPKRVGGYWDCWYTRAADGTVCDSQRVCLDGECSLDYWDRGT